MSEGTVRVEVYESAGFAKDAPKFLKAMERAALRHYIAANPVLGEPIEDFPGLRILEYEGSTKVHIVYTVSETGDTIDLISIYPLGPLQFSEEERKALTVLLKIGKTLGRMAIIRWAWELFTDST